MVNDVDKSLLDRLQALRGGPAGGQPSQAPQNIKVDVIERAKTPSREDALTARLRSLREGSATPEPERQRASPNPAAAATAAAAAAAPQPAPTISEKQNSTTLPAASSNKKYQEEEDEVVEHVFETDDDTLQELLADVTPDEDPGGGGGGGGGVSGAHEPSDEQVRALLEKLADDIPKDLSDPQPTHDHEPDSDNDGSDSEAMKRQVEDVVERYQDEAEMEEEETQSKRQESEDDDDDFQDPHDEAAAHNADLPSVPSDLQDPLPSSSARSENKTGLDDITARLAALRAPSHNTDGGGDDDDDDDDASPDSLSLPSVPTSRPSVQPVSRLQTRTGYTDDDADSWCTVCLEDATLRCLGCDDDDVYCARCWHEMHVGPAAAFDDRSHRAVQFTRDRKKKEAPKKVALGA